MRDEAPEVVTLLPLPAAALYIVTVLARGPMHGYALMAEIRDLSGGTVRLGPGTLYGSIKRMVSQGLLEETVERSDADDDPRRRYYEVTDLGRRVGAAERARLADLLAHADVHPTGPVTLRPAT